MIDMLDDFQPRTSVGKEMKRMIENGDHTDGHFYWFIDTLEKLSDDYEKYKSGARQDCWKLESENKRLKEELSHFKEHAFNEMIEANKRYYELCFDLKREV
jgi:FMN phosphatase YigB (HAD superfamily)